MARGFYQLLIRLDKDSDIPVGSLGQLHFRAGYYVYTGSAMGGLEARIARHLRHEKRFHWHIDYLLEHACIIRYAIRESVTQGGCARNSPARQECELNSAVLAMERASIPVKGFGSSDCGCEAHLVYFEREPGTLPAEATGRDGSGLRADPGQPV